MHCVPSRAGLRIGNGDVRERTVQRVCQTLLGQLRGVVALAQMRRHQQIELIVLQRFGDLGRVLVGQMALRSRDALFQKRWVGRAGEQTGVMVALQEQGVAMLQRLEHMQAAMTQIGQDAKVMRAVAATQLQRFTGIVRNGEWGDVEASDGKMGGIGGELNLRLWQTPIACLARHGRASAHPNGLAGSKRKCAGMSHVVCVFVGDKQRIQIVEVQIGRVQPAA